jgi:hypothetical protein
MEYDNSESRFSKPPPTAASNTTAPYSHHNRHLKSRDLGQQPGKPGLSTNNSQTAAVFYQNKNQRKSVIVTDQASSVLALRENEHNLMKRALL